MGLITRIADKAGVSIWDYCFASEPPLRTSRLQTPLKRS